MLYHVSETPGIKRFEPRPSRAGEDLVWAVDRAHLANYLLPRDCPRVTFCADADTTPADSERLMAGCKAARIVAVEAGWHGRIASTQAYLYGFEGHGFELQDAVAGYYVTRHAVEPVEVAPVGDLIAAILAENVELRFLPELWELRERAIRSTIAYSIVRMRNATPPEAGFEAYHPL